MYILVYMLVNIYFTGNEGKSVEKETKVVIKPIKTMDLHSLAKKLFEKNLTQIEITENIERLSVGQAMPEIQELRNKLKELKNELIENKDIIQHMIQLTNQWMMIINSALPIGIRVI